MRLDKTVLLATALYATTAFSAAAQERLPLYNLGNFTCIKAYNFLDKVFIRNNREFKAFIKTSLSNDQVQEEYICTRTMINESTEGEYMLYLKPHGKHYFVSLTRNPE